MATAPRRPPTDLERTYAGILGKMAGVYLGRPVEGWSAERIRAEHGDLTGFLPGTAIPVSDDDLSGAFTFVRALEDAGFPPELTPERAGEAWLDHLIEGRSTLWWGGVGSSTEHTAYLRLAAGMPAPRSGSAATNGRRASEQIGGRIFADTWGLVHPREPRRAAAAARAAAQVSHDGVAVDAAGMLAASVAAAFDGAGVAAALARGRAELPAGSPLHDLIDEVRAVHRAGPDWRAAHATLAQRHPYARYGGHCPLVPNEAVLLLALTAAPDDLAAALAVAVGCGWDTDCNAGNVGTLIGVALGLEAFATPAARALRSAMNDRLFVVAAEGGESVTDALTVARRLEAYARGVRGDAVLGDPRVADAADDRRALDGRPSFDFSLPGATQGFGLEGPGGAVAGGEGGGLVVALAPVVGSAAGGAAPGADGAPGPDPPGPGDAATLWRLLTPTATSPAERDVPGYALLASPTLYPGQTIRALASGTPGVRARLVVDGCDPAGPQGGPEVELTEAPTPLTWRAPATTAPIAGVGLELRIGRATAAAERPPSEAQARLLRLDWDGAPRFTLDGDALRAWRHAWVDAFDHVHADPGGGLSFVHDRPGGWASLGGRAWADVRLDAEIELPHEGTAGIFGRGRGARRRLALRLVAGGWRLDLDGPAGRTLASGHGRWAGGDALDLALEAHGRRARAWIDGRCVAAVELPVDAAPSGAAGVLAGPGTLALRSLTVWPAGAS